MDQVQIFKGCLPQVLLGPFLNTLSCIYVKVELQKKLGQFIFFFTTDPLDNFDEFKLLLVTAVARLFWIDVHGRNSYKENVYTQCFCSFSD